MNEHADLTLTYFGQESVDFYWPNIDKALDETPETWFGFTKEWIYTQVKEGKMHLFGLCDEANVFVTLLVIVHTLPNGERWLKIVWAHGKNIEKFLPHAEEWLDTLQRILECTQVEIETPRKGWKKLLAAAGFVQSAVVLRRRPKRETLQ